MEGYLTTTEAASRLGMTSARVRQLIVDGALPTQKVGSINLIKESDVELFRNHPGTDGGGRPPKDAGRHEDPTRRLNDSFRKATEAATPKGKRRGTIESQTKTTRKLNQGIKQIAEEEMIDNQKGEKQ